MAESGQEFLPSPIARSRRAGNSSGGIGDLELGAKTSSISASEDLSACSLTTAAALRSTGCSAACLRSWNSRFQRLLLTFDSHQVLSGAIFVRRAQIGRAS